MDKKVAIKIITQSAKVYNDNLLNKNVLFLYQESQNGLNYLETTFLARNFVRLTGVELQGLNKIKPTYFFKKALNNRLSENDIGFKCDGTTVLKLEVIPQLMRIKTTAKMIGEFHDCKFSLYTDKVVGGSNSCMGFVEDENNKRFFIPNTLLKKDLRDIASRKYRIIATFSKCTTDLLYNCVDYKAKDIYLFDKILPDLIDINSYIRNEFITFCAKVSKEGKLPKELSTHDLKRIVEHNGSLDDYCKKIYKDIEEKIS